MRFTEALVKIALAQGVPAPEAGKYEKYVPWYTSAAGGALGHSLGGMLPKKYQAVGRMGGMLLGTGIGVHGGEMIGKAMDKRAEEEKKSPTKEIAKTIGVGALGMAGGTAAGRITGELVDKALMKSRGHGLPAVHSKWLAPLAGAGLGTSYALWKAKEKDKIQNAVESARGRAD